MTDDARFSVHYWAGVRSANPSPTCRRGGCGDDALDGSEYCNVHAAMVEAGQAWADSEQRSMRRQGRIRHPRPADEGAR